MRKTILFLVFLIAAGTLSYFGGYYFYVTEHPKVEYSEPIQLQKAILTENNLSEMKEQEYYYAKLEQNLLMIYKMPDEIIYDCVEASNLQIGGTERERLLEGVRFETLTEVFEFLENAMS